MPKTIKTFPLLYGKASNGKIKTVQYSVEQLEDGTCNICNEFGYLDGKKQIDKRNIKAGKNIGKSNETTISEQAISEAESKWNKKKDENYTENSTGKPDVDSHAILPMLAHDYRKRGHDIKFPCFAQPKLDGVRALATLSKADIKFTSRKYKPYDTVDHINKDLIEIFKPNQKLDLKSEGLRVDGELYKHGLTLQEINRRVKKYRKGDTEELEYWVFDLCLPDVENTYRKDDLDYLFKNNAKKGSKVKLVPTYVVNNDKEVKEMHDKFVQEGFEGVILRNMDGLYEFDKRSKDLQKYKEFQEEEFLIVGTTSGEGTEENAIMFICETKEGKTFPVRPRGSIEDRREWWKVRESFLGKDLTVRFFNYTEDKIPFLPVGKPLDSIIRDYE